ncbi:MAG: hypothetical protein J6S05_05255, partial [Bacteroidaceae bacterium]|nr:hypothetical protein [Bacteroidaceae bacterium]
EDFPAQHRAQRDVKFFIEQTNPSNSPNGPSPLPSPRVAMEIAPLMEHRLTFSQSSKDSIRHKGGEYNVLLMGHKSVVTTPSPCGRVGEGSLDKLGEGPWVGDVGGG